MFLSKSNACWAKHLPCSKRSPFFSGGTDGSTRAPSDFIQSNGRRRRSVITNHSSPDAPSVGNPQPQGAEQSSDGNEPADDAPSATEPEVEDATDQQPAWSEQPIEPPELEPANDNSPVEPLSATRTE